MNKRIDILIGTKDRPTELALLLQSLRTQTYQDFDIFILEDAGKTPAMAYYFVSHILTRLKCEGHKATYTSNRVSNGTSKMRNQMAKLAVEKSDNDLILRVDDDTILESDFLERLVKGIDKGYDIMTGITPPIMQEPWKRDTKYVKPLISKCHIDSNGNLMKIGDDCGYGYLQDEIIPCEHFRSFALYKKDIHNKADIWYADNLTHCGYREEEFFAFKAICEGFKIGCDVQAICWHLLTPSGGDKRQDYGELAKLNEETLKKYVKRLHNKYGNFLYKYKKRLEKDAIL